MKKVHQIRQGDVMLIPVAKLPVGCVHIEPEGGRRFVLAHGEVTGHAHAIYEFTSDEQAEQAAWQSASDAANEVIEGARASASVALVLEHARTLRTAQMWSAPDGEWYLEIRQESTMRHEEHSAPKIPVGIYHCPVQVEAGPDNMNRLVAD